MSVVLPAWNEEANVGSAVHAVLRLLDTRGLAGEVIVVDDGSTDRTPTIVAHCAARDRRVRLLTHETNRGYGAALRSGIAAARGEHLLLTDADLQFDVSELGRLDRWVSSFDIVVGYRSTRRDPWLRLATAWGWNLLVNRLFDLGVRDVDCAFKIFHRRVFDRIGLRSAGAFVSSEILARARAAGFRVKEVPVTHLPRVAGVATGARPNVIGRAGVELTQFYLESLRAQREEGTPEAAPCLAGPHDREGLDLGGLNPNRGEPPEGGSESIHTRDGNHRQRATYGGTPPERPQVEPSTIQ